MTYQHEHFHLKLFNFVCCLHVCNVKHGKTKQAPRSPLSGVKESLEKMFSAELSDYHLVFFCVLVAHKVKEL